MKTKKSLPEGLVVTPEREALIGVIDGLRKMSPDQIFELAVRAGIYDKQGRLTKPYRIGKKANSGA